ncbi:type II secretion system F family protein [Streptomyces sp. NA02950]|uniref:type II secretion system F family protein n=1 Tax=Streptomyces sp. NA02950 TaxID=2742137 RepID=UPI0015918A53|nr:type II secretion system F family protein [Streptomyces sp. NA02950]QKV94073.1 type II secretion system F family protein [Streptomyces sp. NA02950]
MSADVAHRLGIVLPAAAAVLCTVMAALEFRRERAVRRRLAALLPGVEGGPPKRPRPWRRWRTAAGEGAALARTASLGALLAGPVVVEGPAGWVLGFAAAYGVRRWQRRRQALGGPSGRDRRIEAAAARQIPLAADLLTACLAAGAGPRRAAEAVGASLGGPVGERLARTAAELRLGGEPADVWGRMGALSGARGLARALERAGTTGAPAVEPVSRVAAECRAQQTREAVKRADRTAVRATAPLTVCFLPAYLLVGLAPVMVGLAGGLMGRG